ncbi:MAG: polysaccharide biosynthesis C-terminal domain-containing protein [Bacteroidales bacterium]|nr:polysaccharide biosynthesis C-terminal domain-containing protein [Bacteroidales bacterium]
MLRAKRYINNVAGLQAINILRFLTFLIISIVFTKIGLSKKEIGVFEVSIFIASAASFFWVSGLIQAFLPLFNNNKTFGKKEQTVGTKSPEVFNMYVILVFFSVLVFLIGLSIKGNFSVFGYKGNVPLLNLTLWYLLLSSPANLVEYIYMVQDKNSNTLSYGYITSILQLVAVILPVVLGYDVIWSLRGLIVVSSIKNLWLVTLLYNYAEIKFSFPFIKEVLAASAPIIFSVFVSGSAQYVDGLVVTTHFSADGFAIFRYGAKELPFVVMLAAGLSSAMLVEFSRKDKLKDTLAQIKHKSLRIMHYMYPLSIVFLLFAKPLFKGIFSPEFTRSADIFVIYILAIVSRLLFPHTIIIGLKKGKVLFIASIFELIANIFLSIYLVQFYGVVGVALATVIVYFISKIGLIIYNHIKLGINPLDYIPVKWYVFYSFMLAAVFVLLDRGIIDSDLFFRNF